MADDKEPKVGVYNETTKEGVEKEGGIPGWVIGLIIVALIILALVIFL